MRAKKYADVQMGSRIQDARLLAGMTQEQLSEAIDVTPQYLSDLERGKVGTSITTLINLCSTLHVPSDYILFGKNDNNEDISYVIERIKYLPEDHLQLMERMVNLTLEALEKRPANDPSRNTDDSKD